jgi:hypothetical protein
MLKHQRLMNRLRSHLNAAALEALQILRDLLHSPDEKMRLMAARELRRVKTQARKATKGGKAKDRR